MAESQKLAGEIRELVQDMEHDRQQVERNWEDISKYVAPGREFSSGEDRTTHIQGKRRGKSIYDGSPVYYVQQAVNGIMGQMANPEIDWFRTKLEGDDDTGALPEVREWLQKLDRHLYQTFHSSNFYEELGPFIEDGITMNTASMWIEEDFENQLPIFTALHPYEVYISTNQFNQVDTRVRKIVLQARNAVIKFDPERLSQQVVDAAEKRPQARFEFIHSVRPRKKGTSRVDPMRMPFESVYMEPGEDRVISESGYRRFPGATWRWRAVSGEEYGKGPGHDSLTDLQVLNKHAKNIMAAADLALDPALDIPEERLDRMRLGPGGRNAYTDPNRPVRVINEGRDYKLGRDYQDQAREVIRQHFLVDFFLIVAARQGKQMTAREVSQLQAEQATVLGPIIGRMQTEAFNPIFDRVFDVEFSAGRIPEMPEVLLQQPGEIGIDYLGPLSQAQKRMFTTSAVQRSLELSDQIMARRPETMDVVDWDKVVRDIFEKNGMPQDLMRSEKDVTGARQARAQEAAQDIELDRQEKAAGIVGQ